jgi:hypothetical protein
MKNFENIVTLLEAGTLSTRQCANDGNNGYAKFCGIDGLCKRSGGKFCAMRA